MKRTILVLTLPLFLLSGCAQLFDSNLFEAVDIPPPLNLKNASVSDIQGMMTDPSFAERLKSDPEQLINAQDTLLTSMNSSTDPTTAISIGATLVELTASASNVSTMQNEAVTHLGTVSDYISSGEYAKALKVFMGSQTEAEMKVTLDNLMKMAEALDIMQTKAASSVLTNPINRDLFYTGVSNEMSFSQSAFMAAAAHAMVLDNGSGTTTDLAALLATANPATPSGDEIDALEFSKGQSSSTLTITAGKNGAATYSYTYVATVWPSALPH